METLGLMGLYGLCAYDDVRTKTIREIEIIIFGVMAIVVHMFTQRNTVFEMVAGVGLGFFVYLVAVLSDEKIGKGDALLVAVTGLYLGFWDTLIILFFASVTAAIVGFTIIIFRKEKMDYEMPFVPFMLAGLVILCGINMYVSGQVWL